MVVAYVRRYFIISFYFRIRLGLTFLLTHAIINNTSYAYYRINKINETIR